jgi:sugar phosphate isomerase/epimerase
MRPGLFHLTLATTPFERFVRVAADAGFPVVGLVEAALPADDEGNRATLASAGLDVSAAMGSGYSILPLALSVPGLGDLSGPAAIRERRDLILAGIRRLARYRPATIALVTGPPGDRSAAEARRIVVETLRAADEVAGECGVRLTLEPLHRSARASLVTSLSTAAELLADAGTRTVGLCFDTHHLGLESGVAEEVERFGADVWSVQIADRPARDDRRYLPPGSGATPTSDCLRRLADAGYTGYADVELLTSAYWNAEPGPAARELYRAACSVLPPAAAGPNEGRP